jgi:hypothetical protein
MVRSQNLYINNSQRQKPYKLSRSRVDLFLQCPRCFYIDRKLGTDRPFGYPFTLNNAVDQLLKQEFDYYRSLQQPHPYMVQNNINAIPYNHSSLNDWRNNWKGLTYFQNETNLIFTGAIDDLWIDLESGELIVVDYKSTSRKDGVSEENIYLSYKRQIEFYQWLLMMNGQSVSPITYFVYLNGLKENLMFDDKLNFTVKVLRYRGNTSWIPSVLNQVYNVLESNNIPQSSPNCTYCIYVKEFSSHDKK